MNLSDAKSGPVGNGAKFAAEFASRGARIGARKPGVSLAIVPPGAGKPAHRIENTSAAPLRYLTFSTKPEPEVVEYPDSARFGAALLAGKDRPTIRFMGRIDMNLDCFDGA